MVGFRHLPGCLLRGRVGYLIAEQAANKAEKRQSPESAQGAKEQRVLDIRERLPNPYSEKGLRTSPPTPGRLAPGLALGPLRSPSFEASCFLFLDSTRFEF